MKKFLIPILIVPFFAIPGCSDIEPENNQVVVQKDESTVVKNEDGSLSKSPLITSYENAKAEGYQGSLEDWVQLVHLTETQPEVAKQQLEDQGLDATALLTGAALGLAAGGLIAANSSRNVSSNSYSQQRTPSTVSQPLNQTPQKERASVGGGGAVLAGSSKPSVSLSKAPTTVVARGGFGSATSSGG